SGIVNTDSGNPAKVFTINQNGCSPSARIGVHDQSESVFTMGRNMHALQSTSIKHNYRLAYAIQDKTSILSNHIKYINHLIPNKKLDEAKTPKYEKRSERIISQSRMKEILSNIFGPPMSHKGKTIEQLFEFHNKYVISVWFILSLVTGHRSVNEPLGTLSDFNKHNKTWIIGDKERRSVSALRTVILPDLAVKQL